MSFCHRILVAAGVLVTIFGIGLSTLWSTPVRAGIPVECLNCVMMPQGLMMITDLELINTTIETGDQNIVQAVNEVNQSVKTNTRKVKKAVNDNENAVVAQLKANLAGEGKLTDAAVVAHRKSVQQLVSALGNIQAQREFGYGPKEYTVDGVVHRPTSQPLEMCSASARAQAVGKAITTVDGIISTTDNAVSAYNNSAPSVTAALDRYDSLGEDAYNANLVISDMRGLTPDEADDATEWIKTVTNPHPTPVASKKRRNTIAGKAYNRSRKIYQSQLEVPQHVLADLKSDVTLSVPLADSIKNKWSAINPNKQIQAHDGKVSPLTVLRTQVAYRYSSQQWTDRLSDLTTTGVLRELAMMRAVQLQMQYEQYQLQREQAAMLALNTARDLRQASDDDLQRQRIAAFGLSSDPSNND